MDAVLIAGGKSEPSDPLYPYTGDGYKSLLMLGGKPMVQWVLDALNGSKRVERVVVVGLPQDTRLNCTHELSMLEGCGDLIHNIRAGAEYLIQHNPDQKHCLLISADIPALTTGMVDWLIDRVQESDHDLYYNVIERRDMETRFPQSRRTYVHMKDGEFCGGDAGAICKHI
ncbi:MAG: nucleotidyltransferase family protein, partial [Anaerolineaceae bacterium]|nr:nucleotidyltransferase family protein [Anaerolineaceae bacterium]